MKAALVAVPATSARCDPNAGGAVCETSVAPLNGQSLPPGWRPTWRAPKRQRRAGSGMQPGQAVVDAREAVREWLQTIDPKVLGPLLPPDARRELALRVLAALVVDPAAAHSARVGAARLLQESAPALKVPGWAPDPPALTEGGGAAAPATRGGTADPDPGSWR